jgi:diguanylate cyclase (GGDEF)-like protein/PAS domain S-box-containing protein
VVTLAFDVEQEEFSAGLTPPLGRVFKVALLLIFLTVASRLVNQGSWDVGGVTILWPTNAFLMGVLLCNPKRHWPAYAVVAGLIDLVFNLSLHDSLFIGGYMSACNLLEAILGATLLYPILSEKPDLTQRKQLVAFLCYGVLLAPLVASFAASFAQAHSFARPTVLDFFRWFTADALGIATVTPLYLAFNQNDRLANRSWIEVAGHFVVLTGLTLCLFWQNRFPVLFVLLPSFLLLGLRLGLAGSAMGLLLVALVGGWLTTAGHGPIWLADTHSFAERDLLFQFFIAMSMLLLYIVEVMVSEAKRLQAIVEGSERRFRLLAEASHDIIFLSDLYGRRTYVSPSVVDVLGWRPEQIVNGTYRDLAHPDDHAALQRMFEDYREDKIPPPPGEFRYRKADGSYLWLEFNPRLYYDDANGEPTGFVDVVRDISRRKSEEADFHRTLEMIERMASSDSLTGIANRRHFDFVLEREWLRAAREQTSVALLLIDVDCFKAYNDARGHLTGDECLRQVIGAIKPLVNRPADLLARFGGEEFVVVLPYTDATGARQMAEWIRQTVQDQELLHPANLPHGLITVSIGCAAVVPGPGLSYLHLVERADRALYCAKSMGRNRVVASETPPEGPILLRG